MRSFLFNLVLLLVCSLCYAQRPNVLFIAIDDLNDFTGLLKGHPQAITPNLDKLMNSGISFTNAHTAAPHCGPSRNAIFSGLHPSTTGLVQNASILRSSPAFGEDGVTLPQYFMKNGYHVIGTGKLLHSLDKENYEHQLDPQSWHEYFPGKMLDMDPNPLPNQVPMHSIPGLKQTVDWGPLNVTNEEMSDWKNAKWIVEQLKRDFNKPFFMAYGVYRPHLPRYAPKKYFDMFPLNEIILPEVDPEDVEDLPPEGKNLAAGFGGLKHSDILKYGEWKSAVQAYLATITFADDCIGLILDALNASPYKDNTIIVAWSDHGYHLGEKNHWMKFTLWEESTRVPFTILAPGVTVANSTHGNPVSLLDIYPTLIDLAGLPSSNNMDGESLVPILKDPTKNRSRPVLITYSTRGHALKNATHKYIRYSGGGEELYDHTTDPDEWTNLAGKPGSSAVINDLKKYMPGQMPIADKGTNIPPKFTSHSHDQVIIGESYHYEITFYKGGNNNLKVTYGNNNPAWLKNNNGSHQNRSSS